MGFKLDLELREDTLGILGMRDFWNTIKVSTGVPLNDRRSLMEQFQGS